MDATAVEAGGGGDEMLLTRGNRPPNRTAGGDDNQNNQNKTTENSSNRTSFSSSNNSLHCCRICLDNRDPLEFISPCQCSGTLKYVHRQCFLRWVRERSRWGRRRFEAQFKCEICNTIYLDYHGGGGGDGGPGPEVPELRVGGFFAYLRECFNFREANRSTVAILIITIHLYLLYYVALSGPLEVTVHSAVVPDMDIPFLWAEKSDAYVAVCLDRDCRCETEVADNDNTPRWEHRCEYWADKSAFLFSRLTFLVYDADNIFDQTDDFIGEVSVGIGHLLLRGLASGKLPTKLKWEVPYRGSLLVTVRWTSNLLWLLNRFY